MGRWHHPRVDPASLTSLETIPMTHTYRTAAAALWAAALTACASTGASFRSGTGDRWLEHPPWVAGTTPTPAPRTLVHAPITFAPGDPAESAFDPPSGPGSSLDALVREMNAFLDSLKLTQPVSILPTRDAVPPDVRFGCGAPLPNAECTPRGDSALGRGRQEMLLAVGRPSRAWVTTARDAMVTTGATHVLVLQLEIGQYLMRQEGLVGRKVVELGTGHRQSLPWMTSLETPVPVLQLTGALVDTSGRAVRIGAEGFHLRRTRLLVSAIGGQELLGDADIGEARVARRDDLPGTPLAWRVAMTHLLAHLLQKHPASIPSPEPLP